MMDLTKIFGWTMLGLSIFLMLDAALAMILGDRYRRWGLAYLPAWYGRLMERLYSGPKATLWGIMLAELGIGIILFWLARMAVLTYNPL